MAGWDGDVYNWERHGDGVPEPTWQEPTLAELIDEAVIEAVAAGEVGDLLLPGNASSAGLLGCKVPATLPPPPPQLEADSSQRAKRRREHHGGVGWAACYACLRALPQPFSQFDVHDSLGMVAHLSRRRGERWEVAKTHTVKKADRAYEQVRGSLERSSAHATLTPPILPVAGRWQGGASVAARPESVTHLRHVSHRQTLPAPSRAGATARQCCGSGQSSGRPCCLAHVAAIHAALRIRSTDEC